MKIDLNIRNFGYYALNPRSDELSPRDKNIATFVTILMGFTLGLGHLIAFIYTKRTGLDSSRTSLITNDAAQKIFNPDDNSKDKQLPEEKKENVAQNVWKSAVPKKENVQWKSAVPKGIRDEAELPEEKKGNVIQNELRSAVPVQKKVRDKAEVDQFIKTSLEAMKNDYEYIMSEPIQEIVEGIVFLHEKREIVEKDLDFIKSQNDAIGKTIINTIRFTRDDKYKSEIATDLFLNFKVSNIIEETRGYIRSAPELFFEAYQKAKMEGNIQTFYKKILPDKSYLQASIGQIIPDPNKLSQ